jgi:hypothetical protein
MIKYLELVLSQEVYEYLEELDEMNWSARGNVLNQYLRNTSIGTTVKTQPQKRIKAPSCMNSNALDVMYVGKLIA